MKSHQMLVHIDGKRPYCVMVETLVVSDQLIQIASNALQRYNSINCTTFDISQVQVFMIDENDTVEIPVKNFDQDPSGYEMVIRLPDFEPIEHKITVKPDSELKYIESALELKKKGDFLSAITMSMYTPGNYLKLSTEFKLSIYSQLKPYETKDFRLLTPQKLTLEQLLQKCEESYDNIMLFRMYCLEISKKFPFLVIKIIFNFPETLQLLPEFTDDEEKFEYVLSEIKQISVTPACLKYISEIYFNQGLIEYSSRIYNSIDMVAACSDEDFRNYCWKLFLLHDMPKLHQSLVIFFRINRQISIGVLTFDRVYQLLCDLYTGTSTLDSINNIHYTTVSYESRPFLCHICFLAGLCLFYCGMFDQFYLIFQCHPGVPAQELLRMKPSAREWKVGKAILLNQGWGCEKLPKDRMNCVLADYPQYKYNFSLYPVSRPHDTYLLSHVSFYEIANPLPSFSKRCFWNLVDIASQYHTLTILNGRYDYKTVMPHLIQNRVFASTRAALDAIANCTAEIFTQIHEKYPHLKLVFVELPVYDNDIEIDITDQYNELIKMALPDFVQFLPLPGEEADTSDLYGKCFPSVY